MGAGNWTCVLFKSNQGSLTQRPFLKLLNWKLELSIYLKMPRGECNLRRVTAHSCPYLLVRTLEQKKNLRCKNWFWWRYWNEWPSSRYSSPTAEPCGAHYRASASGNSFIEKKYHLLKGKSNGWKSVKNLKGWAFELHKVAHKFLIHSMSSHSGVDHRIIWRGPHRVRLCWRTLKYEI